MDPGSGPAARELTPPAGRSPVLLHGFAGSSEAWGEEIEGGLAAAGLAPVLVDLPGHGRHAGSLDEPAYRLDRVHDAIDVSLGTGPGPLVGYSMGGRIALSFACARPERVSRLVLESASPGLRTAEERRARRAADAALAERIAREGVEAFVDAWEARPLFASRRRLPPDVRARQRTLRLRNDAASLALALRRLGTGALPSAWDALATLSVPALLLAGALDRKFVDLAGEMEAWLPRAERVVVDGAGHTVHLERPAEWMEAVVRFLGSR